MYPTMEAIFSKWSILDYLESAYVNSFEDGPRLLEGLPSTNKHLLPCTGRHYQLHKLQSKYSNAEKNLR